MAKKQLSEKQHAAVTLLAQPQRANLTYEEIAERVGIARSTLQEWRKMDHFNDAVKKQVVTNTIDDLPKVYNSIVDAITEEHNAAMARTYLQSLGMLTEKHEVESKDSGPKDMESVRQMIAQHKSNTDSAE